MCNRDCEACTLELNTKEVDESKAIGIEKLLSDSDNTISLFPENNERIERRDNYGRQD
jgi:lysine 2,3-aminomutase